MARLARPSLVACGVVVVLAIACATDDPTNPEAEPVGELLVSAAASLTDAFGEVVARFETAYPDVDVVLNLGGSTALAEQVLAGAPVDVLAVADAEAAHDVMAQGLVDHPPTTFAVNELRITVPAGNPSGVTGLGDLAREELFVGLCAETVPCGRLAREALARAGVEPSLDTEEPDVRALLTKLAVGELDVGITYVTDVRTEDRVDGLPLPSDAAVSTEYLAVVPNTTTRGAVARTFVEFLVSDPAQDVLAEHGFVRVQTPGPGPLPS